MIDLDNSSPLDEGSRIRGDRAVTQSSYSRGLGGGREPGVNMRTDETTFDNMDSDATEAWLHELEQAAQDALE